MKPRDALVETTLLALLAAFLVLAGCGGDGGGEAPAVISPSAKLTYSGFPEVFDAARQRLYAPTSTKIVAIDPVSGGEIALIDNAADVPTVSYYDPFPSASSKMSLSKSGTYLYIASSSGQLTRLNLATGQVDQRLDLPAAAEPSVVGRVIDAVVASATMDDRVLVAYAEIANVGPMSGSGVTYWITQVDGTSWSDKRVQLPSIGAETLTMKPDGAEVLVFGSSAHFTRVRLGKGGPESVISTGSASPRDSSYPLIANQPQYTQGGILWGNRLLDPASFATLFELPGQASCSLLANPNHAICVGPGEPSHALYVYDLERRTVMYSWAAGPPIVAGPTGRVSAAGAGRVIVHYSWLVYKGYVGTAVYTYTHPGLN